MTLLEIGLLLGTVVGGSLGQILLKLGALKLGAVNTGNMIAHVTGIALIPEFIAGIIAYGLGAVAYILLLTRVELSIASPASALIYVFAVLFGYFFLKEPYSLSQSVGLGLIMGGVILVTSH
ncbi:MAG: EamA family transporter [Cyanobacteria bacterium P01_D01_bin.44]